MKIEQLVQMAIPPSRYGRVAVLMGGAFAESEISLFSGRAVLQALKDFGLTVESIEVDENLPQKLLAYRPDRVFIAMHGTFGEDGTLQGLLEALKIPYTGSGVVASALGMDKEKSKWLWQAVGLPTLDFIVTEEVPDFSLMVQRFGLPLCVKPNCGGSSLGVTRVEQENNFTLAVKKAFQYDKRILIEPWIEGEEVTVGIVGETALPVIRIIPPIEFYDYEAKYFSEQTQFQLPSGLSEEQEESIQQLALSAYKTLNCRHWGRIDAIMDTAGKFYLLELNTIPGLTSHSLVPQAAQALGIDFTGLILAILNQTL